MSRSLFSTGFPCSAGSGRAWGTIPSQQASQSSGREKLGWRDEAGMGKGTKKKGVQKQSLEREERLGGRQMDTAEGC